MAERKTDLRMLALGAILTALVIILQLAGQFIRFGVFSISLVLVPIVIGAALCGPKIGAWLGLVFSVVVLLQPDTGLFYSVSIPGTIVTVLLKGVLCGLVSGLVYKLLAGMNRTAAAVTAAVVCPIVNTGVFLIGCRVFFFGLMNDLAEANGYSNAMAFMFLGLVGLNFIAELVVNLLLSPAIVRILDNGKNQINVTRDV